MNETQQPPPPTVNLMLPELGGQALGVLLQRLRPISEKAERTPPDEQDSHARWIEQVVPSKDMQALELKVSAWSDGNTIALPVNVTEARIIAASCNHFKNAFEKKPQVGGETGIFLHSMTLLLMGQANLAHELLTGESYEAFNQHVIHELEGQVVS